MCSVPGLWPGVQLPDTSTLSQALTPSHIPPPPPQHRQRIYTKAKAKVVTAVWGTELIQFLAKQI